MRKHRAWLALVGLLGAAIAASACAVVFGIEDGTLDPSVGADASEDHTTPSAPDAAADDATSIVARAESAPPDATGPGNDAAPPDGNAADGSANDADPREACAPGAPPDDTSGVFVATTGSDGLTCGTRAAPCATVQTAIARAITRRKTALYLAPGTYVEAVALRAGFSISGGWDITGTTWTAQCPASSAGVMIQAPSTSSETITAVDISGTATLAHLTISSKAQASVAPGETVAAVKAVGASTTLLLDDVTVSTVNGGDGATGGVGLVGTDATTTCDAPGSGAVGAVGPVGTAASAGTLTSAGYAAQAGSSGFAGFTGSNGTPGGSSCRSCGTCQGNCRYTAGADVCSNGRAGCGGGGGGGGAHGGAGGSSFALLVWDARVTLTGGKLQSGKAGAGGTGAAGGAGGAGAPGTAGANKTCTSSCTSGGQCIPGQTVIPSGTAGGPGGQGGEGGQGAGGSGGWSFAIASGGAATVTLSPGVTLVHGAAGAGAGASPAGREGDRFP